MSRPDAAAYLEAAKICGELLESLANYAQRDEATLRLEEEIRTARLEALKAAEHANRAPV
jgi:hypothetical protein